MHRARVTVAHLSEKGKASSNQEEHKCQSGTVAPEYIEMRIKDMGLERATS